MKRERKENRSKKKSNIGIILLIVFFVGVLLFSGYKIYEIQSEWSKGTKSYQQVAEKFVTQDMEGEPEVNFTELQEEYPMTTSWIRIEGTRIDYPVAQWSNNQYYLNHLLDGTKNKNGTIFVDCDNNADLSDRNTFIYGHHMKNGSMFAELVNYKKQNFYTEHPVIEYITPEKSYRAEIFSAQICEGSADLFTKYYKNDADFEKYLKKMQQASLIKTNVSVTAEDRILTLVTCTYEYDDARFIVQAKLVEE